MKSLSLSLFLFLFSTMSAQDEVVSEIVHAELKSGNPEACPEKKAEYIEGIKEFRGFIKNSLQFSESRIRVHVIEEKKKKKRKKTSACPTNLEGIKWVKIEIENTGYTTQGAVNRGALGITPPRGYPAVVSGDSYLEGHTLISFIIEEDGMVSNVKIIETTGVDVNRNDRNIQLVKMIETELIRVIYLSAGKWLPAETNCKAVRVEAAMPINWEYITRFNRV